MKTTNGFEFKRLDMADFKSIEREWGLLHTVSRQSVFTSWTWMYTWWTLYKERKHELFLWAIYRDQTLVGIAPFYKTVRRFLKGLSLSSLEFIGHKSTGEGGFRAEYLDLILDPRYERELRRVFISDILSTSGIDEFCFNDSLCSTVDSKVFWGGQFYEREVSRDQTYIVRVGVSIEEYCANLGKGTRARMFGSRSRLRRQKDFEVRYFNGSASLSAYLYEIDLLYRERWAEQLDFDSFFCFLDRLSGVEFAGTQLIMRGKVIGASLNIVYQGVAYNLLLGFGATELKRVSLGLCVLGYDIEMFCGDDRILSFDLLAGEGKRSNYKASLGSAGNELVSRHVYTSWLPRNVYSFYDRFLRS